MRLTASYVELVWSVGEHQVPGLGDGQGGLDGLRSRISPIRMMSGSCRSTYLSAAGTNWCRRRPRAG